MNRVLSIFTTLSLLAIPFFFSPQIITPAFAIAVVPTITIPTIDVTKVRGHVIGPDGQPWKFKRVVGTCDGKTTNGITNGSGNYLLYFIGKEICADGAHVHVSITGDGKQVDGDGTVHIDKDGRFLDMNLSVLDVTFSVPEFSPLTGIIAIFVPLTIYLFAKRRKAYQFAHNR